MKKILGFIMLVFALTQSAISSGAEANSTAIENQESSTAMIDDEKVSTPTEEMDTEVTSNESEDVFVPSVQISEDLSVSFPVNI